MNFKSICIFGALMLGVVACNKSEQSYPTVEAIVTIKSADDQSCYLQLNDDVALKPTNSEFKRNPYGKEVRSHIIYYDKGIINETGDYQWREVTLSYVDTILTKKPVKYGPSYGDAPVEIYHDWATCMEDGYLTLHFEGMWGTSGMVHRINLVKTENPLIFILAHDDAGDLGTIRHSGLVAFDMHDIPTPNTEEYDIIIVYQGYTREKTLYFHYKDGKFTLQ